MTIKSCAKVGGATVILIAIVFTGISIKPTRAHANNDHWIGEIINSARALIRLCD
jgi:hypothetical protein